MKAALRICSYVDFFLLRLQQAQLAGRSTPEHTVAQATSPVRQRQGQAVSRSHGLLGTMALCGRHDCEADLSLPPKGRWYLCMQAVRRSTLRKRSGTTWMQVSWPAGHRGPL